MSAIKTPAHKPLTRRDLLTLGGAAAGVAALSAPLPAQADTGTSLIVGSWTALVTLTEPPLPAPVGAFTSLMSFMPGGVFGESHRYYFPPLMGTAGYGAWKQIGENTYEVFTRFITQLAPPSPGTVLGTDNIHMVLTHDPIGRALTGHFDSELRDTSEAVLQRFRGTVSAVPISV